MLIIARLVWMQMMILKMFTSVTDEFDVAQAHRNLIEEISNATFVLDDGEQEQAHERVNSSLDMCTNLA